MDQKKDAALFQPKDPVPRSTKTDGKLENLNIMFVLANSILADRP